MGDDNLIPMIMSTAAIMGTINDGTNAAQARSEAEKRAQRKAEAKAYSEKCKAELVKPPGELERRANSILAYAQELKRDREAKSSENEIDPTGVYGLDW